MNRFKLIFLFTLFFVGLNSLLAQKTKFTGDTAYLNEMNIFMGFDKAKDPDPLFTQFSNYWQNGKINSQQKKSIVQISNNLMQKRARPNPHFVNFLKYILSVLNSNIVSGELENWLRPIETYSLSGEFNIGRLDKLISDLAMFNDSAVLYQSKAVLWKHNAVQYRLGYDLNSTLRIQIPKTDLICFAKRDSTIIGATSGYYYPLTDQWRGTNGTVTWERAGFSKDSVYARLNNYFIELKFSEYKADTVEFTNKKYLKGKLVGHFEERVLANVTPDKASYPKFYSYDKSIDIHQVVPNIDYSGGFAMDGAKFNGYGDSEKKAELFVYKGKDVFAKASALNFTFDRNNIIANNARVYLIIDQDTLWHPGLNFNYLIKNERVALNRSGGGLFRSNFYDSYHKLEIDVNEISFDLKDTVVLFKSPPATTYRKAIFQSSNYFSNSAYQEVALMDRMHPLEAIRNIAPSTEVEFEAIELAQYLEKAETYSINLLLRLSDMGFVEYDVERKLARPKQKLFDYIRSNYGKKDYDAIQIISEPPKGSNAILNLKDNVLTIYGVESFVLSNNRRVGVIPDNYSIRIKKDLEIDFDGRLQAGLAWLTGKNLTFNYDSFYVQLERVDSLSLTYRSETKNKDSLYVYTPVTSTIDSISGLLRIDYPENKSGRKIYPVYPILESHKSSYVFYEQHLKDDTVYSKSNFYVENYPFEIDSLNTVLAKNISFRGNLNSGGVFPGFDEDLVVMKDNSLGFIHQMDSTGMPIYNGLARYDNTVKLDNSGLKGDGSIRYLNTTLYAEKFNFYPDSMNSYARNVEMARTNVDTSGVRYPYVTADSVYVFWVPKKDSMLITSLDKPFSMFEDKAQLNGLVELNTKELAGQGILQISDAQLDSKTYTFFDESLKANAADFTIQPIKGEKSPFLTYNVRAEVDFDKKLGIFNSNGKNSYIDMPVSQYKCYMNYFSWHMGINQIDIGTTLSSYSDSIPELAIVDSLTVDSAVKDPGFLTAFADTIYTQEELASSSKFVSTNSTQDSLSFYANSSSYDIKNYIIKAKGVKLIKVADAIIYPSTYLTIMPGAVIKTIENAHIMANRVTSYHRFYDASIDIKGANKYFAAADYEYFDRQDSLQMIHFGNISVNADNQTIASGEIKEDVSFKLSPEFDYFGKVFLEAPTKNLHFDGYAKMNHLCEQRMPIYWLQFKSVIDPDSVIIPVMDQPIDNEYRKLQTDIFLTADSMGIYPGFLTTKRRLNDVSVLGAKGLLFYNVKTGYYEITDSTKFQNHNKEGNYLSIHRKLCLALGEGKLDLGVNLGQVSLESAGTLRYLLDSWQVKLELMLGVNFFFNDVALGVMADKIKQAYALPPLNIAGKSYQKAFKELVGLNQKDAIMNDFSLMGTFSAVPPEMNRTLFFSDVKMNWNHRQSAWQSEGKIGLGNVKGTQINKMLDGYIEVKKLKSGDILNIYLEIDPKNWYFFTYTRGTLKTVSSDNDYNNVVSNLKDKYRKPPVKDEDNPYMFFPATERAKDNFIEEMKKQKLEELEAKDINLDRFDNSKKDDKTETETETSEDESVDDNNNKNKNQPIEIQDLNPEEIKNVEELKKNEKDTELIDTGNQVNTGNENRQINDTISTKKLKKIDLKEDTEELNLEEVGKNKPVNDSIPVNIKGTGITKKETVNPPQNKDLNKKDDKKADPNKDKIKEKKDVPEEEEKIQYQEEEEDGDG